MKSATRFFRARFAAPMVLAGAAGACVAPAHAQCNPFWSVSGSTFVPNDYVGCLGTYNGNLIAGGRFTQIGPDSMSRIARWNGSFWSPMGGGVLGGTDTTVGVLRVYNNQLIVGGHFTQAGSVTSVNSIARWTGSTWQAIGTGVTFSGSPGTVAALCEYNGELIVGGFFNTAGGVAASNIARWNGSTWQALGAGVNNLVMALAVHNGDLYAGGSFTTAGGNSATGVASWNGSTWSHVGGGVANTVFVAALEVYNGQLIAGGNFTSASGNAANRVARFNGTSWQAMSPGMNGQVSALKVYNGELYAGGLFAGLSSGTTVNRLARWNGTSWSTLNSGGGSGVTGGANPLVWALEPFGGQLVIGGFFTHVSGGSSESTNLVRWNTVVAPAIDGHPQLQSKEVGENASFSVSAEIGPGTLAYQWRRDAQPVSNGAGGASIGGGTVSGATQAILNITGVQASDAGDYDCVVTRVVFGNPCANSTSDAAALSVTGGPAPCYPNCDQSTTAPVLNVSDFTCYLQQFAQGTAYANCDQSTTLPVLNVSDFTCFLQQFAQGCP